MGANLHWKKYSTFWKQGIDAVAQSLLQLWSQDDALDLLGSYAAQAVSEGWDIELEYMILRVLKPNSPIGLEVAA